MPLATKLLINCNKAAQGWLFYDKNVALVHDINTGKF